MQKAFEGSCYFAGRHELDRLAPSTGVGVTLAARHQLADLVAMATREIPGVNVSEAALAGFLRDDPESIFVFQRAGILLGGIAFLYLNCRGHDALLLEEIDLKKPDREFLARHDQEVSAIYVWALACHGRAVAGLGNVAEHLRRPRFSSADYFAQPSTKAGRDLLVAIGFTPTPSFQPDLWIYQRSWKKLPLKLPPSVVQAERFVNARH